MQLTAADIKKIKEMPMNFIMGKERSGTSLLQLMLNSHPNIVAPPEARFIILQQKRFGRVTKWTEEEVIAFCDMIFRQGLFKNHWKMNRDEVQTALLQVKEHLTYPIVCKTIYYLFGAATKQVEVLFDKNPIYYYFLPELEKLFPEANFIHLVRDYRANIASHQKVFRVKSAGDLAYRWVEVNKMIEESKKRLPERYYTLRYEDLVAEPEKYMKEVCSFLKLPFNENMSKDHTEFMYSSYAENKRPRFLEFHGSLLKPINKEHVEEWREKLQPKEIEEAEAIAGEFAQRQYKYKPSLSNPKIGAIHLAIIKLRFFFIKRLYRTIFKRRKIYRFIRLNVWNDF